MMDVYAGAVVAFGGLFVMTYLVVWWVFREP